MTSIISRYTQKYIGDVNLMPKEQKGCCSGSKWCKDHLLISKAILQECKCRKKKLCMAWIDYQKAFNRVPHNWIIKSLESIGINNKVISFTKKVMTYWRTCMCLHTENKLIETEDIKIQCGRFQGDSLSPLLFCICLIPFTEQLWIGWTQDMKSTQQRQKYHTYFTWMIWSWSLNQRKISKNK